MPPDTSASCPLPNPFAAAADILDPPSLADYATPGALAQALDPTTVQTPALDLIDAALVDVAAGRCPRLIVSMPPQEGKGLDLETPIATPDGWTAMGELEVGDEVFGTNGTPCRVTAAYEPRELDCYRVTFQNLSSLTADGDHLWRVQDRNGTVKGERRTRPWIVVNTRELARDPVRYGVPVPMPLELPDRDDLLVDPYVLGAWLGDGHSTGVMLTCADQEIVDNIRAAGVPCRKTKAKYAYSLAPAARGYGQASPIRHGLVELGVFGNKHIPIRYLRSSEQQRLALLQGLMDTDGSVDANESGYSRCEFTGMDERLTADVLTLTRSLGIHSASHESRAMLDGRDIGPRWRVRFTTDLPVFRLSRKAARLYGSPGPRKARHKNGIRSVELVASRPTRCIEVDSADQTFLAGEGLIPTHNSSRVSRYGVLWMLRRNPNLRVVLISYGEDIARHFSYLIRGDVATFSGTDGGLDLGLRLRADSTAAGHWMLAPPARGSIYAIGLYGGITGRPVDLLVIDDPVKDYRSADSELLSEQAWQTWMSVARPRLAPGAPVIVVLTRWAEDDLGGRLIAQEAADVAAGVAHYDHWRVINIPAQADHDPATGQTDVLGRAPGEFMLSARGRTTAQWQATQAATAPRIWNALYQGRPAPDTGDVFQRRWWRRYPEPLWSGQPDGSYAVLADEVMQSWDMTFKDTDGTDYVVGQVWARRGADVYLLDQVRARMSFTATVAALRRLTQRWPQATAKLIEAAANGPAVIDSLRKEIGGMIPENPAGSKTARARAVSPFVEAGNVHLPAEAVALFDVGALIEEAANFPRAGHDDQVDALSQALKRLLLRGNSAAAWAEAYRVLAARTPADTAEAQAAARERLSIVRRPVPVGRCPARADGHLWRDGTCALCATDQTSVEAAHA